MLDAARTSTSRRARCWLLLPPRVVLAAVTALSVLVPGSADRLDHGLLVAALLVGAPHGAVDVGRLGGTAPRWALGATAYAAGAGAVAGTWWLAPLPTLIALLALSVVHFGAADLECAVHAGAHEPRRRRDRLAHVVGLGGVPVVLPLGMHGHAVLAVLDPLTGGHGTAVVTLCRWGVPVVVAAAAWSVLHATRSRSQVGIDTAVLLVAFLVLPPLAAFSAYFASWHAWRQSGLLVDQRARRRRVPASRAGAQLLLVSLAPAVGAALVAVLAVRELGSSSVTAALVLALCLTVPHTVVAARSSALGDPLA